MHVTLDPRASRLLALMHEADAEAVTLDELQVAGVEDPATALRQLELAGFTFERVIDRTATTHQVECLRLARGPAPEVAAPGAAAPTPLAAERTPVATLLAAADRRPVVVAVIALMVAVVVGRAVAGRRA